MNRSGYPPSPVQVNELNALATRALPNKARRFVEPNDMPPPYQGTSIVIFGRESLRRLSSSWVETSSRHRPAGVDSGKRNRKRSNPPPEAPTSLSRCFPGGRPVSAIAHVPTSRSGVQRQSPKVSKAGLSSIDRALR